MKIYKQQIVLAEIQIKLAAAKKQITSDKILSAKEAFTVLRENTVYNLVIVDETFLTEPYFHLMAVRTRFFLTMKSLEVFQPKIT